MEKLEEYNWIFINDRLVMPQVEKDKLVIHNDNLKELKK